ncbi:sulfotransferase ssu-1-like [Dermacentor andersoni]|uniref:sulfotransferase ssu-1-like n=1 Tax=Dermacentor andersoni TaxID=34620 RepID=UPI00215577DA|nr:sulfotransferase ssu-1-like [Dermacentor andersoni]
MESLSEERAAKDANEAQTGTTTAQGVYHVVYGLYVTKTFTEKNLRSAFSYKPIDEDVFIVGYPKCGTTWLQFIVYSIYTGGAGGLPSATECRKTMAFLEISGAEGAMSIQRPGIIKSHLPFHLQPYSAKAKYIYVARNPYDCCVSFYHHTKYRPRYDCQDVTFDQFLGMFVRGEVDFGDYFDHLLSWCEHRGDLNVLFLTYEELNKDTPGWVLRIADFLGKEEYGNKMSEHPSVLDNVVELTSFQNMKTINEEFRNWPSELEALPDGTLTEATRSTRKGLGDSVKERPTEDHVRKGIVGDWKNHFSPEQAARMKERIALKTGGTDVVSLWKGADIP